MTNQHLGELKFRGCNGHSKVIRVPGGEEITAPLLWIGELKLVHIPHGARQHRESEETYLCRIVSSHGPAEATDFAKSDEIIESYLGVQYYRTAKLDHALDDVPERIPVGLPKVFSLNDKIYDKEKIHRLVKDLCPKDAIDYIHTKDLRERFMAVQYYKVR